MTVLSQVAINADGSLPDSTAMLDVKSTSKGLLIPRMTQAQIAAIVHPADGLMVFCTTDYKLYFYYGPLGQWKELSLGTGAVNPPYYCGNPITVNHISGSVAPVNKTVTYHTVTGIPGESAKCWITQNLGSDHQATAVSDATEPSAGWYWQFNKPQGYKHDGTTRTPNTTWNSAAGDESDWLPANDPCALLLATGWHIPTYSEWYDVDMAGSWNNWNGPWNSTMKMHAAGSLGYSDGALYNRGTYGIYQSSTTTGTLGWFLFFGSNFSDINQANIKSSAKPVRCIREWTPTSIPTVTTAAVTNVSRYAATGNGEVTSDGGIFVTQKGFCWSTTPNPTISSSHQYCYGTSAVFSCNLTGLSANTLYYVRAFAVNSLGTAYGNEVCFTTMPEWTCGDTLTKEHFYGGAPLAKTTTYNTVTNIPGELSKCWITQNLGASHQANAADDTTEASAGWYWQFNRLQGYKHDGTTRTPNTTWVTNINQNSDWQSTYDPCSSLLGAGWRLPTISEWGNVNGAGGWTDWNGPWNSALKIHAAGLLGTGTGNLENRGINGGYWSTTQYGTTEGYALWLSATFCYNEIWAKSTGFSVRCVK